MIKALLYIHHLFIPTIIMSVTIHPSRYQVLQQEFEKAYFAQIKDFLVQEKAQGKTIYPK